MKPTDQKNEETVNSMDKESVIFKRFRMISPFRIRFLGRTLHCLCVERLIKSVLFSKSWIDSSSKSDPPPDFRNEKHRIMMEFMRVDDAVKKSNGKKVKNSFAREHIYMEKHFGLKYREKLKTCELFFAADTRNDAEFNFKGYFKNFERILMNHSDKADSYHKNYPKCKTLVLFICDESNAYYQPLHEKDKKLLHFCFFDSKFLEIIKRCKADYVVWFTLYKTVVKENGKEIKQPLAYIYDVKHLRESGTIYNHDMMVKVK